MARLTAALLLILATISSISSSQAMELSRSGNNVYLTGSIKPGDQISFIDFINLPQNASDKNVYLNSGGGSVIAAIDIARHIRSKHLSTVVDGRIGRCSSACTALFGSGVHRHYVNSGNVRDGVQDFGGSGLGFHQAKSGLSGANASFSGAGTGMIIGIYHEMGIGNASDLADRAPPDRIYRLSGQTALAMGIATSLGYP